MKFVSEYPHGLKEEDVMLAMSKAIAILAPTFTFGYYDVEDIRQEAYIFGLEALSRYDTSRPLENFLYTHIKNRLINFKRDKFHRTDPPCKICHNAGRCTNGDHCNKYKAWRKRNNSKQNLMRPLDIQSISDDTEKSTQGKQCVINEASISEYSKLIDLNLPVEIRSIYLRIKSGEAVSKIKKNRVEQAIREIINGRKEAE